MTANFRAIHSRLLVLVIDPFSLGAVPAPRVATPRPQRDGNGAHQGVEKGLENVGNPLLFVRADF